MVGAENRPFWSHCVPLVVQRWTEEQVQHTCDCTCQYIYMNFPAIGSWFEILGWLVQALAYSPFAHVERDTTQQPALRAVLGSWHRSLSGDCQVGYQ